MVEKIIKVYAMLKIEWSWLDHGWRKFWNIENFEILRYEMLKIGHILRTFWNIRYGMLIKIEYNFSTMVGEDFEMLRYEMLKIEY